jgi:peptide/nickel transport system ATP-binding protein/oligopeptide transport system ATP-binding protein
VTSTVGSLQEPWASGVRPAEATARVVGRTPLQLFWQRGDPPSPAAPPPACHFHTRCQYATEICRTVEPPLVDHGGGHLAACHHPLDVRDTPAAAEAI